MATISADPYRSPFMGKKGYLQFRFVFRCLWTYPITANDVLVSYMNDDAIRNVYHLSHKLIPSLISQYTASEF